MGFMEGRFTNSSIVGFRYTDTFNELVHVDVRYAIHRTLNIASQDPSDASGHVAEPRVVATFHLAVFPEGLAEASIRSLYLCQPYKDFFSLHSAQVIS